MSLWKMTQHITLIGFPQISGWWFCWKIWEIGIRVWTSEWFCATTNFSFGTKLFRWSDATVMRPNAETFWPFLAAVWWNWCCCSWLLRWGMSPWPASQLQTCQQRRSVLWIKALDLEVLIQNHADLEEGSRSLVSGQNCLWNRYSSSNFEIALVANQCDGQWSTPLLVLNHVHRLYSSIEGASVGDVVYNDKSIGPLQNFFDFLIVLHPEK